MSFQDFGSRIRVEGGLKPTRKDFATRWWARRWIEALQRIGHEGRLQRGRTYARSGQVLTLDVRAGEVVACVQGSRRTPYEVRLTLEALAERDWEAVLDALAARAAFAAQLLVGEMPADVEEAFGAAGAALMPATARELRNSCSCPDWGDPCKHAAAVHYLLADAFDDDPFLMFRLRGRDREAVMEGLRQRRGGGAPLEEAAAAAVDEPLPEDPDAFWRAGAPLVGLELDFHRPEVHGALLLRMGPPGPWTTAEEFRRLLEPVYRAVSGSAVQGR